MSKMKIPQEERWYRRFGRWFAERRGFILCFLLCVIGGVGALYAFHNGNTWNFAWPADHNQWGLYGDFVGGVLGTIVAVFSVYFLIKTLRTQQNANDEVLKDNKRRTVAERVQQLDNSYYQLMDLYHDAIKGYTEGGVTGRDAIKGKVEDLSKLEYNSETDYKTRVVDARKLFESRFYAKNRINAAVHFRVLYRIFDMIEGSGLDERDFKVKYAKLMRCQLDEYELVLLRYNCGCLYGAAMREYINHYNLLKHLPPLNLLEFKFWHNILAKSAYRNAMDAELIAQKKWISTNFGDTDSKNEGVYHSQISPRYELDIKVIKGKRSFTYTLCRHNNVESTATIDNAFDVLSDSHTTNFIKDFLCEVFCYSNFEIYNKFEDLTFVRSNPRYDGNDTYWDVSVVSKQPMYLRYRDYKNGLQEEKPEKKPSEPNKILIFLHNIINCAKKSFGKESAAISEPMPEVIND